MLRAVIKLLLLGLCLSLPATAAGDLLERATTALETGDHERAATLYAELRRAEPRNPAGWYGGGLAAEATAPGQALELLARAAELDPGEAAIARARGRILARLGAVSAALDELERARALDPANAEAYLVAALLLRDAGRLDGAESVLRDGIARAEPQPELWDQLGLVLLSRGRGGEALASVEKGLDKFPSSPRLELVRGLALALDPSRQEDAVESLERALGAGLGGVPAHLELANLLLAADRVDEALGHLERAVALAESSPEVHFQLAQGLRRAGRNEDAARSLARFRALREAADRRRERELRLSQLFTSAVEHVQANRPDDALAALDEFLAAAPGNPRALALRAKILFSAGDLAGALEAALAAREADPSQTEHHYLVGLFAYHSEKFEEAEPALARALAMDPELGLAHELTALLALRDERPADAVTHFEKAIAAGVDTEELRQAYALAQEAATQAEPER